MFQYGPWNSVRGESNCWTSEITQETRAPGLRRIDLVGSRTIIGYGPGFVRIYSTFPGDNIPAGVTMSYEEALSFDNSLNGIVRILRRL